MPSHFERGIDPKDAMGIGRNAHVKKLFQEAIRNTRVAQGHEDWEVSLKWNLWTKGIEVQKIVQMNVFPKDYEYKFYYKDCNGEEAHIMKEIVLTAKEIITA